jgi:hypothetical protein
MKFINGITIALGMFVSTVMAQEPGWHAGINAGYVDIKFAGGNAAAGLNLGYAFNENVSLGAEYTYKSGTFKEGHLASAFLTLATVGNVYFKGKIGGTTASGDSVSGSSASIGAGIGYKINRAWVLELDYNQYSSDVKGGNFLIKRYF